MPQYEKYYGELTFKNISDCYRRACYGADSCGLITTSRKILKAMLYGIYDEKTLNDIAKFYNITPEEYIRKVLANEISCLFMGTSICQDPTIPENEIEFRTTRIGKPYVVLVIKE